MHVLQFGLTDPRSTHHPSQHVENAVVYTGTHDNDTARGWFESLEPEDRARVLDTVGGDGSEIEWEHDPLRTGIARADRDHPDAGCFGSRERSPHEHAVRAGRELGVADGSGCAYGRAGGTASKAGGRVAEAGRGVKRGFAFSVAPLR